MEGFPDAAAVEVPTSACEDATELPWLLSVMSMTSATDAAFSKAILACFCKQTKRGIHEGGG